MLDSLPEMLGAPADVSCVVVHEEQEQGRHEILDHRAEKHQTITLIMEMITKD